MSSNEEADSRRAKRRKVRRKQSNRIERTWVNYVESYPPYMPGDLMPPYEKNKKRNGH